MSECWYHGSHIYNRHCSSCRAYKREQQREARKQERLARKRLERQIQQAAEPTFSDQLQRDLAASYEKSNEFNGYHKHIHNSKAFLSFTYLEGLGNTNASSTWPNPHIELSPPVPNQHKYPTSPKELPDLTTFQIEDALIALGEIIHRIEANRSPPVSSLSHVVTDQSST
jgi:hypothetical protein